MKVPSKKELLRLFHSGRNQGATIILSYRALIPALNGIVLLPLCEEGLMLPFFLVCTQVIQAVAPLRPDTPGPYSYDSGAASGSSRWPISRMAFS